MKRLITLMASLLLALLVMGFVGCSDPGSNSSPTSYTYEGVLDSQGSETPKSVLLVANSDGSWYMLMAEKYNCKGTYTGNLNSDGSLAIKITHEVVYGSDDMKPCDPPRDLPATLSENATKLAFTYGLYPLVLTRK